MTYSGFPEKRKKVSMRFALLILLTLSSASCCAYHYDRTVFQADGKTPASECHVTLFKSAIDTKVSGVDIALADGTRIKVAAADQNPDPNVVTAVSSFFQTVAMIGGAALKLVGIP